MNANDLLHYMRGFFELVTDPTPAQLTAIRNEILRATIVDTSPTPQPPAPTGDCGCSGKSRRPPPPPTLDIDPSKL